MKRGNAVTWKGANHSLGRRTSWECLSVALAIVLSSGCEKSKPPLDSPPISPSPTAEPAPPAAPADIPRKVEISQSTDDPDRWLFLQKVADRANGGWATGSFDPPRNKITIQTRDIEGFALDTSRIRIDWRKLVVLSIDGKNSELRKRDVDLLNFDRTPSGEWVVRQP